MKIFFSVLLTIVFAQDCNGGMAPDVGPKDLPKDVSIRWNWIGQDRGL